MIQFICTGCRKVLRVKDESAGKRGKCPKCGVVVEIPSVEVAQKAEAPLSSLSHPKPQRPSVQASPPPAPPGSGAVEGQTQPPSATPQATGPTADHEPTVRPQRPLASKKYLYAACGGLLVLAGIAGGIWLLGRRSLILEVTSIEKADYYASHDSLGGSISSKEGYSLLVVKIRVRNKGTQWAKFSSTRFHIRDKDGQDVDAALVAVDDTIAPSGGVVTVNNRVSDADRVEFFRYKGKLSPHLSLINWELASGKERNITLVYVVPADVEGGRLLIGD